MWVALRKESVDRNFSARPKKLGCLVALRKESVDRNRAFTMIITICIVVALRKESVDRNTMRRDFKRLGLRRSPEGERG